VDLGVSGVFDLGDDSWELFGCLYEFSVT